MENIAWFLHLTKFHFASTMQKSCQRELEMLLFE